MSDPKTDTERRRADERGKVRTAMAATAIVLSMAGLSYAAVPLYKLFCQVTGYGGTTQRAETAPTGDQILDRTITVRFDANSPNIPWEFNAAKPVTMRIGETATVNYHSKNLASVPTSGQATFMVTPEMAGAYFNKIQCFCFNEQTLQPGEAKEMGIYFYVDPAIADVPELKNLTTITLSYTMFPLDRPSREVASAPQTDPIETRAIGQDDTRAAARKEDGN